MYTNQPARKHGILVQVIFYMVFTMFFLFRPLHSFSQTYYFDTYAASEGISSKIYCIIQDQYNNIWLGTPGGAARFDGRAPENFNEENGLAPQGVYSMMLDSRNNIWFGHLGGGISVYENLQFRKFNYLDSILQSDVTSIFQDQKDRIWITTYGSGAFLLPDPYNAPSEYIQFLGKDELSPVVFNYCLTKDGTIFLNTDVGVRKYLESEEKFEAYHPEGLTTYFNVTVMYEDSHHHLWFGTYNGGAYKYEPENDTVIFYDKRDGLSSQWISTIREDSKGNIWIGTWGGGITRISPEGIKIFDESNGLIAREIHDIIEDSEGNILIASHSKGFSIYKGDLIENYGSNEGLKKNTEVFAITQDKDLDYWIGTNDGIVILPGNLNFQNQNPEFLSKAQKVAESTKNIKVRFLKIDAGGVVWIGTEDQRMLFYEPQNNKLMDAFHINRWFYRTDMKVFALELDQDNILWVGTSDGLIRFQIKTGEIQRFSNDNGLIGNSITALYCDPQNQLWVGAYGKNGISKITQGSSIINYPSGRAFSPSSFIMDNEGKLWIGTNPGLGLFLLEGDSITYQAEISRGLLSNVISTLNADENNAIYIGTNRGLNVYDQVNKHMKTYNKKNGYLGIETNPSASYYNKEDNIICFGTLQGINKYNIAETKTRPSEPFIYINHLSINQVPREIEQQLKLHFYENHISIGYKSNCLTNPDAVRYRFFLEGLDKEWQDITTQTTVTYQALPPGKYSFKVISRNSEGIWSTEPAQLDFVIVKPFYKRWYIIVSAIAVIVILFWLYVKIRERNLIHEKIKLQKQVDERTNDLKMAKDELEEKNTNITDSIRYALRIQMSILPPPEIYFNNMFVLFKPKDIVSGDFYWMARVNGKEIIAAVDCTGHGVPGAFMSFIGYSSLNKVVREKQITKPSDILDKLNESVVISLNLQGEEAIKDGMDLAVITWDPASSELEYAGAYNPLYHYHNGELNEIKADRFAIGKSSAMDKKFTNHTVKIEKGDMVYIFSDGYADQFGGEEEKKFKPVRVRALLDKIHKKDMPTQKRALDDAIEEWRGNYEQVDDILFIGKRF